MDAQIKKLSDAFVDGVLQTVREALVGNLRNISVVPKPRGATYLTPEERSVIAKKAALTRKRRAAARKAVDTKRRQAGL
jgi:hypothetical protein